MTRPDTDLHAATWYEAGAWHAAVAELPSIAVFAPTRDEVMLDLAEAIATYATVTDARLTDLLGD
jgi:predicted RNase H-like HicB family nuclease